MKKLLLGGLGLAFLGLLGGLYHGATCPTDPAPRSAVEGYLRAMQSRHFEDAYAYVTAKMTDGRPRAEWATLQAKMFEMAAVKLADPDVRTAHRAATNRFQCAPVATVPNVLRAADVLNNQGSTEFELYTVILENGHWRIDTQETLFEEARIHEWFPHDEIPAYKGTAPTDP